MGCSLSKLQANNSKENQSSCFGTRSPVSGVIRILNADLRPTPNRTWKLGLTSTQLTARSHPARGQRLGDRGRAACRRLVGCPSGIMPEMNPRAPQCSLRRHLCRRSSPMLFNQPTRREFNRAPDQPQCCTVHLITVSLVCKVTVTQQIQGARSAAPVSTSRID
jgi:hypothetical protein